MKIAIDGTAASGKGTLSNLLSKALKLPRLDTGLLYRKVAFSYIKSVKLLPRQNTIENYLLNNILDDFDIDCYFLRKYSENFEQTLNKFHHHTYCVDIGN